VCLTPPQTSAPSDGRGTGKYRLPFHYSGRSRSKLHQWAAEHEGLFLKDGASTLVDFDVLDRIMDSLPRGQDHDATPREARPLSQKKSGPGLEVRAATSSTSSPAKAQRSRHA